MGWRSAVLMVYLFGNSKLNARAKDVIGDNRRLSTPGVTQALSRCCARGHSKMLKAQSRACWYQLSSTWRLPVDKFTMASARLKRPRRSMALPPAHRRRRRPFIIVGAPLRHGRGDALLYPPSSSGVGDSFSPSMALLGDSAERALKRKRNRDDESRSSTRVAGRARWRGCFGSSSPAGRSTPGALRLLARRPRRAGWCLKAADRRACCTS